MSKNEKKVIELIKAQAASDGDGVKLLRVFGGTQAERFDPFLLLDEFGSESSDDYIGGFPPHPHRGFETVTYMLQGKMEHRDHLNNVGLLSDGDLQWMTAGKGIIHSEMPKQTEGKMRGFQLWVNLPARNKMSPAAYRDIPAQDIPVFQGDGFTLKAIAGKCEINHQEYSGLLNIPDTHVGYFDVHLNPATSIHLALPESANTMVYCYDGSCNLGEANTVIPSQALARLGAGESLKIHNDDNGKTKLLLLFGTPLKEAIAQYGPFVMNTPDEIEQAISDYQRGVLTD